MDFFQAQDSATSRSRVLVVVFLGAVIAIILAIYAAAHLTIGPGPGARFDPYLFAMVALLTGSLIAGGSAWRASQLSAGGHKVASLLGGRRIAPDTDDPDERRLMNVVEEMSIASGIPVPHVFVMDRESGINAFAAGHGIHDAAVAVTRGALQRLDRAELQGVMAHEFSHILNGDMRLNVRLIGLLYGILLLSVVGRGLVYGRGGRRGRGGGQIAILGLVLIIVGYIGVFFGRIIQAAVSRQREYLADASAVQLTRNPDGLANALKKVGGLAFGSRILDHHAQELGHLFFANGLSSPFLGFLATHPPLVDRIRRLDPAFDGRFEPTPTPQQPDVRPEAARAAPGGRVAAGHAVPGAGGSGEAAALPAAMTAAAILSSIGSPGPEHVARAERLLDNLSDELQAAAHEPEGAQALVLALLMTGSPQVPDALRAVLARFRDPAVASRALELQPLVRQQGFDARLPLLDLALPALRTLPGDRALEFRRAVRDLVRSDGQVRIFEYTLVRVLERHLGEQTERSGSGSAIHSLRPVREDVEALLSAIAWTGSSDPVVAAAAFERGARPLSHGAGVLHHLLRDEIPLARIDAALRRLERLSLPLRRRIMEACAAVAAHDGEIRPMEANLLRAIAESLDLPLPHVTPLAGTATTSTEAG